MHGDADVFAGVTGGFCGGMTDARCRVQRGRGEQQEPVNFSHAEIVGGDRVYDDPMQVVSHLCCAQGDRSNLVSGEGGLL